MGLTIHYNLKHKTRSAKQARATVEKIRQLAMDLPFDRVGELRHFGPEICQQPLEDLRRIPEAFSAVLDTTGSVNLPWAQKHHHCSIDVQPLEIFSFNVIPGPGCEWASFGLAKYPTTVMATYRPQDDDQFNMTIKSRHGREVRMDSRKWLTWLANNRLPYISPDKLREQRLLKVKLGGWRYRSFCKTQYASNPACGGLPNFIRCHVSLICLLERLSTLGLEVGIDDEGKYGRSYYTDDYRVAKPVYTWHDGQHDVKALAEEVGDWNEMIAAALGGLQDAAKQHGGNIEAEITQYPDFEHLEFRGQQQEQLVPFLRAMQQLAKQTATEEV